MSEMKNVAKYSIVITALLIISKLSGFVNNFVLAALFGATRDVDIFRTSQQIPNSLYSAMAAALVTSFIPVFANVKNDRQKANDFFNNILNILIIICISLAALGIIFAPFLTKRFAGGFDGDVFTKAVSMTRILMPSIIFFGITGLYAGYLQSYGTFIQPAITGITANAVLIIGLLIFHKYGIIAAVVSFFIGSAAQVLVQRPFMKKYKYRFHINFKDENVRKMLILAVPTIISTAVSQINPMVAGNAASRLGAGNIAIMGYANNFSTIINQVFIISITTILYPTLTEKFANRDMDEFRKMIVRSINIVVIVAVPLVFGLASLSSPIIKLLLERGKFTSEATQITSLCLKYLAFGALGYSLLDILSKAYYSTKDTLTPMINGFVTVGMTVVFINIFGSRMGVSGLAFAQALAICTISLLLFIQLNIKLKGIDYGKVIFTFIKTIFSGAVMGGIVLLLFNLFGKIGGSGSGVLALKIIISTAAGAGVYIGLMSLLRVDEFKTVVDMTIGKFIPRKKTVKV